MRYARGLKPTQEFAIAVFSSWLVREHTRHMRYKTKHIQHSNFFTCCDDILRCTGGKKTW